MNDTPLVPGDEHTDASSTMTGEVTDSSALKRTPPRRQPYPWNRGRAARLPHNLTQEQTARLLRATRANPRDRALLNLMYRYGLRPGEPGLILISDLDLPGRRIRIGRLKRGVPKEYPLFEVLVPILEAYLAVRQVPAGAPTPLPPEQDFLFPSRQLRRRGDVHAVVGLSAKRVHQIVCAYGSSVGIPPTLLRGHCLRHTCGTHLLDAGCGLEDVRDHLGHRSIASTTVYAQITSRRMRERFARLDGSDAIVAP